MPLLSPLHRLLQGFLAQPVIVVSGLPRSGTSMMMKMLEAGGIALVTDRRRQADEDNPEGYFEFEPVKALEGGDPGAWLAHSGGKAVKVISYLLRYLPRGYRYRVIFMRRDLDEVLASQRKMLDRRGEAVEVDDEAMRRDFATHLERVERLLAARREIDVLYLDHRETLGDPAAAATRVAAFLKRPLDQQAMAAVVDPKLYRNRG